MPRIRPSHSTDAKKARPKARRQGDLAAYLSDFLLADLLVVVAVLG